MTLKNFMMAGIMAITIPAVAHAEDMSWVKHEQNYSEVLKNPHANELDTGIKKITQNDYSLVNGLLHEEGFNTSVVNNIAYIRGCKLGMCMNFASIAFDGNGNYWGYMENMDKNYKTYHKIYGHPSPEVLKILKGPEH
ncbi:hypothetical protein [Komagataeibacter sp. FNDCF1]|uniref:hypothetical protein n=1 Tax=Komagataeibacter sp. FNDCF1 TaxID=2878681 RepID=UPI001E4DD57B|nr:hypothetical protein [Komagataeibacter sp. FNDCF1]MCE2563937.1 hypothetical protein [Komagataeibacter sp. FNDCF1]